jgi:hypothetical protein
MKLTVLAVAAACALSAAMTPAAARPYDDANGRLVWSDSDNEGGYKGRHGRRHRAAHTGGSNWTGSDDETSYSGRRGRHYNTAAAYTGGSYSGGLGPRPRRWCGWWMRGQRGGGPELNLAWNWSRWGRPASPQVGAVVVWRHHVGEIVGRASNGMWIVRSGNDGGAVRTRARSVAGAVFRI